MNKFIQKAFLVFIVLLGLCVSPILGYTQSSFEENRNDEDLIEYTKYLRTKILDSNPDSLQNFNTPLQELKTTAINEENAYLLAQVNYNLGLMYFGTNKYIKAIPTLQSALENIDELAYLDSLLLFNAITISFTEIKAFNSAVQYVGNLEYLINKDPKQYAKLNYNISSLDGLYYNLGMYNDAIRVFKQKQIRGENLSKHKPYQYAVDLFDLARYYKANLEADSALHYYNMARNIVESSNFENKEYFLGLIKGNIAEAFIQQHKYEEAIPLLKEDYVASLRAKDYLNSTKDLNILAYCEFKTGEIDNALRHLQGVRELISHNDAPDLYYTNTLYLSQAFSALSQFDSAYYYAKKYIYLTDSIASTRSIEKSAQLSVSVELKHKEQIMQKALLQVHKEKVNAEKSRITLEWIIGASAILAILFLLVLFLLQKTTGQKSKLQKLIVDYEQKTLQVEKSLEEKEYLLKEIHHRVKNNLQIVSGILQLQSIHSKNKEFKDIMQQSQNRIQSMALIHQMLYQNEDIRYIPFKKYIEKLTSQITSTSRINVKNIKVDILIEEIRFDVETAIPLGLIVNELLSNAFKHAFPEGQSGGIIIWLKRLKQNEYKLIVKDDGIGMPEGIDIQLASTLGLQLVTMLSKQMKSEFKYENNGGAEFSIKFSVQNNTP
jgi:two-component sensor histidine kinase